MRITAWAVCEKHIRGLALGLASAIATSPLHGLVANALSHPLARHTNQSEILHELRTLSFASFYLTILIPKTIGNRKKRLCVRLRSEEKHHLRKSSDRKAQISPVSGMNAFLICAFRSADFLRWCLSPERNLTHNLFFLFPIVFGINLIHFFDEKKDGAAENSIVCFGGSIPCHAI